ncbi:MerR family transcriptional regulator [Vibrio sonorensis]|uniref:MerR family transcriptional regulator n=1 Tax=Vibrio sonorensis TaxID=1004316 RepID=UPI000B281E56|nr:MerR family transcriptional regulator [Vibrio sonorensis]
MFIKEASELTGATQRAIRLYESLGLLEVSRSGKYRVYNDANINLIKIIKEGQKLGIQLSEMVSLKKGQEEFDWQVVRNFLIEKEHDVEAEIQRLKAQKTEIQNYRESITFCLEGVDSHL